MKTYRQQTESIFKKAKQRKRKKRAIVLGVCATMLGAFALVLFMPYTNQYHTDLEGYRNSEYYSVMEKIDEVKRQNRRVSTYKNNFEKWTSTLFGAFARGDNMAPSDTENGEVAGDLNTGASGSSGSSGEYRETTDNQVEGVVEGDLLKRTDSYAFYLTAADTSLWQQEGYYEKLNAHLLRVYSIAGAESEQVEEYRIENDSGMKATSPVEMYLSEDCTTLTVFSETRGDGGYVYTLVVSLDVTDPTNVKENGRIYLSGNYISSRLIDGEFLVINSYKVKSDVDYGNEKTFLPQYGDGVTMQSVAAGHVVCPEIVTSASYTVVTKLNEKSLAMEEDLALFSYSEEVYVSATNLFLTQTYQESSEVVSERIERISKTQISCVNHSGDGLTLTGSVCVDGTVKNQYAMDEYENVLRVVTTQTKRELREYRYNGYTAEATISREQNVNLYCVDLTSFETIAKVEGFAPGESAESVRFNGTKAYVCTAVVIELCDPVFFFDLSELPDIKWTDTGTIDGYSSNLIDFGQGYLVGIGKNGKSELKIEVYMQGEGKVDSVSCYELDGVFSEDYKSYLIDRENGLIGLSVYNMEAEDCETMYLLLKLENWQITQNYLIPQSTDDAADFYPLGLIDTTRAFYEDGYLYLFSREFQAISMKNL